MPTVATYDYVTADSKPFGKVKRVEPGRDGRRKEFFPCRFDGTEYVSGLNGSAFPVYRADEVAQAIAGGQVIFFVEGEGKADALRAALRKAKSRAAVTSIQGGCKAPLRDEHLDALNGAPKIVFLVDSDEQGRLSGNVRADVILRRHPPIDVRIVDLYPDRINGSDVADWLREGHTLRQLRFLVDAAPKVRPFLQNAQLDGDAHAVIYDTQHFVKVGDLLAEPDEIREPLIAGGVLPKGGLATMAGKPKAGKTQLALTMAKAVARSEHFIGHATSQGPVLYVALEGPKQEWKNRLRAMGFTDEDDFYVFIGSAPAQAMLWLGENVAKYRPALIIIDTLQRFARVKDLNDYAQVSIATDPLIALGRESGAAILFLHHSGKGSRPDPGDEILGSTAILGSVDTAFLLKRGEQHRTLRTIQRYGVDLPETVLAMDPETFIVSDAGSKRDADIRDAQDKIVAFLMEQEELVDEATIKEGVEAKNQARAPALRLLVESGIVNRTGRGKKGAPYLYAVAENAGSPVPTYTRELENQNPETDEKDRQSEVYSGSHVSDDFSSLSKSREPESEGKQDARGEALEW